MRLRRSATGPCPPWPEDAENSISQARRGGGESQATPQSEIIHRGGRKNFRIFHALRSRRKRVMAGSYRIINYALRPAKAIERRMLCAAFNRPYKCIRLKFATSAEVLPTLNWERRTILWLDYDDRLNMNILGDVATVC